MQMPYDGGGLMTMTVQQLINELAKLDATMAVSVSGNKPVILLRKQKDGSPYVLLEPEGWE